jgi:hypothetical protein
MEIGRCRDNINSEYIYYKSKPEPGKLNQITLLTDFLYQFSRMATIRYCNTEIGGLLSDALISYMYQNKPYLAFIEVPISNNPLDVLKYEKLFYSGIWKKKLPCFPAIIAITDLKIPHSVLSIMQVHEDLSNIMIFHQRE